MTITEVGRKAGTIFAVALLVLAVAGNACAQAFTEGFNNVNSLAVNGWVLQNNSDPLGDGWYAGDPTVFSAQSGAPGSYILAYSGNTVGTGTISNWLITPERTLKNGDVLTFYTRKISPDLYPDRLQVRLSTSGASTSTGTSATSTGDFSTVLLDINPTLLQGVYPVTWTQFSVTVSGLSGPTAGRFAFRYFVPNGGPAGPNSELIGIDQVVYTPYCPAITLAPATLPQLTTGTAFTTNLSQTGGTGAATFTVNSGSLPAGLNLGTAGTLSGTPTAAGSYTFAVTATDANGCSGTATYTVTVCSVLSFAPATLGAAGYLVPFSQTITQTGGVGTATFALTTGSLPAGLLLSAGGVISGTPTETGSFPITISATDQNGCTGQRSYVLTVGCAATLVPITPVCSNNGPVSLSGGAPVGGVYSGTGVSGGVFDPAAGTQTITYTFTTPDGCTATATQQFVVDQAPAVSFVIANDSVCRDSVITLNGLPAGGTYSGPNVTGNQFTAAATGTFLISYTVNNGTCSNTTSDTIFVKTCLVGINELQKPKTVLCYPNPTNGKFMFTCEMGATAKLQLRIISLQGRVINQYLLQGHNEQFEQEIDLTGLPAGLYLLEARSEKSYSFYRKIMLD